MNLKKKKEFLEHFSEFSRASYGLAISVYNKQTDAGNL